MLPHATSTLPIDATGIDRIVTTDDEGGGITSRGARQDHTPVRRQRQVKSIVIASLTVDVGRTFVRNFQLISATRRNRTGDGGRHRSIAQGPRSATW